MFLFLQFMQLEWNNNNMIEIMIEKTVKNWKPRKMCFMTYCTNTVLSLPQGKNNKQPTIKKDSAFEICAKDYESNKHNILCELLFY